MESVVYRRYLHIFSGFTLLILIPFFWNALFQHQAGEMTAFEDIVEEQQRTGAIYGSATNGGYFGYKEALVRTLSPDVVAFGSSRTMQFQSVAFRSRFANAGGSMSNLQEGTFFLKRAFGAHAPKVVILGLDFWWFNEDYEVSNEFSQNLSDETRLTQDKLVYPFTWLRAGRITFSNYIQIALGRLPDNRFSRHHRIGLAAIEESRGFLPDGSYLYTSYFGGESSKFRDHGFAQTLEMVREGKKRFIPGDRVSETRWESFMEMLAFLESKKVKVVLFLPPIARRVLDEMDQRNDSYRILSDLRDRLAKLPQEFHDFSDPSSYGSNDCEFIDGFHAGTVGHHRMLETIARVNPGSPLVAHLDLTAVQRVIDRYSGNALNPLGSNQFKFNEVDFLRLGCTKRPY